MVPKNDETGEGIEISSGKTRNYPKLSDFTSEIMKNPVPDVSSAIQDTPSSSSDIDQAPKSSDQKKRRVSDSTHSAFKIKKQSQLNFSNTNGRGPITLKLKLSPKTASHGTDTAETKVSTDTKKKRSSESSSSDSQEPHIRAISSTSGRSDSLSTVETPKASKFFVKIPLRQHNGAHSGNGVAITKESGSKPIKTESPDMKQFTRGKYNNASRGPPVSRTTIIHDKSKIPRLKFGPLLPLNYSLYDDNLLESPAHKSAAAEKLAFGFPVESKPWAFDVIYIIAFLSTFRSIIPMEPLSPADFEEGLGLGVLPESDPNTAGSKGSDISALMDLLFRKLLALVLNRKKPIARDGQKSALQELKSKSSAFGLPQEWRDDSNTLVATKTASDDTNELIDTSKPDVSIRETFVFGEPRELMNPFHEADFEKYGLSGIASADDRCIMLRCMVTWSLSESTSVKQFFNDAMNKPDSSGDRDTFYVPRTIMKGFVQTLDSKKDFDRTIRNSSGLSPAEFASKNEGKYMDPTADPFEHPQAFRLNEFIAGDCGFHIGRFYLVRMADSTSGRVSSLEQMRNAVNDKTGVRSANPSGFSLYVEDTHSLLTESLSEFGVEFDENGNEVKEETDGDESRHWYCVASTCEELDRFLHHLGEKLGVLSDIAGTIPQSSAIYKPALSMFQYLQMMFPLLLEFETLRSASIGISRASRRRKVEYGAQSSYDEDAEEYLGNGAEEEYSDPEGQDDEYVE